MVTHETLTSRCAWVVVAASLVFPTVLRTQEPVTTDGVRGIAVTPVGSGPAGFTVMPATQTWIQFTNLLAEERGLTNQIYYSGSGVAAGDYDQDRRVDLYFCGLNGDNALYRNLGAGIFTNVAEQAGVRCSGQASTGAAFADIDGDGDLDLLVSSIGRGVRLFMNRPGQAFQEATDVAGLRSTHASMTMALADIDGDRDLDLYVANYRASTFQDDARVRFEVRTIGGVPRVVAVDGRSTSAPELTNRYVLDATGALQENGEQDTLYLNDGNGRFGAVPWLEGRFRDEQGKALVEPPRDWGLSAMLRDLTGDTAPDLYVCNDGESPDRIWVNDGHGFFTAAAKHVLRKTSYSSMGIDFADVNRDGHDDFFVADMRGYDHQSLHVQMANRLPRAAAGLLEPRPPAHRNTLFLNRGDGTYAEIAELSGVASTDWSWAPVFLDVDLDGYEDLLVTTGLEKNLRDADGRNRIQSLKRQNALAQDEFVAIKRDLQPLRVPNFAFRNRGNLTFENTSARWKFDSMQSSHGMALADLDADGDMDVVVSCLNGGSLVYRNDGNEPRLAVRLKGLRPNTQGIGSRIIVSGGPVVQTQEIIAGGRYLSCDEGLRSFACGAATNLTITVRWRAGGHSVISNAQPDHIYEITELAADSAPRAMPRRVDRPMFTDLSELLDFKNADVDFDDFVRQPLLTRQLSTTPPGITWGDLDGDGRDDLLIGPGRGGALGIFRNVNGRFERLDVAPFRGQAVEDIGSMLLWKSGPGTNTFVIAESSYAIPSSNAATVFSWTGPSNVAGMSELTSWNASAGPAAAWDVDRDGDLDLFVAGRVIPGQYPAPASSRFYRNNNGRFVFDESLSRQLVDVGLVNGVVWTDLTGDGRPELVLACEWDSLQVFEFHNNVISNVTRELRLDSVRGWWQGVAAGDFDGDGRMDLVAANWGRNHRYQRFAPEPIDVHYTDVDQDGVLEFFESYHDPGLGHRVPARHWDTMAARFPYLQENISSFAQFSRMSLPGLFGEKLSAFKKRSVNTFDTMLFLNRERGFVAVPLPVEAQVSPAFGIGVSDFDLDGHEDLALTHNFFGTDSETARYDAGRGLLLLGNGAGGFRPVPGEESGIFIYGEGRGVAVCDYDEDGKPDICFGQRNGETKLYRNTVSKAGLRVTLAGLPGNAAAVGASLRAVYKNGEFGPMREVRAGSGWLSQDSATFVFGRADVIKSIWVRWPGGKITETPLRAGMESMTIDATGAIVRE